MILNVYFFDTRKVLPYLCSRTKMLNMKKLASIIFFAALCACTEQGPDIGAPLPEEEENYGMIVLGEKLEDPYSVKNVTKALVNLYPSKAGEEVSTTHLYVRFLPAGQEQYERLQSLGVEMIDHPVDYAIVREGDYYHDPSIPEGEMTWQYAVVPPDFVFPEDIVYQQLDRCHIAEQEPSVRSSDAIDWNAVEAEAFRITGNSSLLCSTKGESSAYPQGRISIEDEALGGKVIGVAGVRVSCNVFVKFAHTYTDGDGNYKIDKAFGSNPRYRLVFKNKKGFGIGMNLILFPASVSGLGKHSPSGYSITVSKKSNRPLFRRCVVNNACWDYYNACTSDAGVISTPPSNLRIWLFDFLACSSSPMFQQGVMIDGSIVEDYLGEYCKLVKFFLPDITLGLKNDRDYASIYSATMHELAHASHFMQAGKDYWNALEEYVLRSFITSGFITYGVGTEKNHGYCEVAEMWAYYMETRLYRERYPDSPLTFGTSFWFRPQIFDYMDGRGLTCYKTFNALLPDVHDMEALKDRLIRLYPEVKSMILLAFDKYK